MLGDFRPLAARPATADGRSEAGHWEGDLVVGKANQTAVATLIERTSRHTLVVTRFGDEPLREFPDPRPLGSQRS